MRRMGLVALCFALGCRDTTSPAAGIQIGGSATPTTIRVGGRVEIGYAIDNNSGEPRSLASCVTPFEVLDAADKVVGPGARACALGLTAPFTLGPNAVLDGIDSWSGESNAPSASLLPPGNYRIRLRVLVVEYGYMYGTPIPITIVP